MLDIYDKTNCHTNKISLHNFIRYIPSFVNRKIAA